MANLDFGTDWGNVAANSFKNGHYFLGAIQEINGMSEVIIDFTVAYVGAGVIGGIVSGVETAISTSSITAGYINANIEINNIKNAFSNNFNSAKSSISKLFNFSKTNSAVDLSGTGEYGIVGGHHVHAKAAFSDDIKYNPKKGFAISQDFMKRNNIDHVEVTKTQRILFKELAESGRPNTLAEHTRIAAEALKAGGADNSIIEPIINMSLDNLVNQGVTKPTNIPWYK